jgi:hypothetical protein
LNIADNDFLNADPAETLADAGTAPGIAANTYGIRGNARPHGALYSVGSDEVAAATAASLMVGCLVNKRYPIKSLTGGLLAR